MAAHANAGSRRMVLLGVAALLSFAAALAIGVLLFGDFGSTEGRVLATTAALAGYGLLALPAAMLYDRRRLPGLAVGVTVLACCAAVTVIALIWNPDAPESLGKSVATANAWLIATVQAAALSLRRQPRDPAAVRRLFAVSTALVVALAGALTAVLWAEIDSAGVARVLGSMLVLDVLLVALQPILARARPAQRAQRIRVELESGDAVELEIEAPSRAAAAARAIRSVAPREVASLSFEGDRPPAGAGTRRHASDTP